MKPNQNASQLRLEFPEHFYPNSSDSRGLHDVANYFDGQGQSIKNNCSSGSPHADG